MLDQGVLGLGQDVHQRVDRQGAEGHGHRQTADEFGDHAELHQVFRGAVGQQTFVLLDGIVEGDLVLQLEADHLVAEAAGNDLWQAREGPTADEQDVLGVDLNVLLLGVLATTARRHVGDGAFNQLQEGLLDAFAGHIAGDRDITRGPGDFVDFIDVDDARLGPLDVVIGVLKQADDQVFDVLTDVARLGQRGRIANGEGHIEKLGQTAGDRRLAAARGAEHQDVGFLQLDGIGPGRLLVAQAFVVVVDRNGDGPLRLILADDVLIEVALNLDRGHVGQARGLGLSLGLGRRLLDQGPADIHAFIADIDPRRPRDQALDLAGRAAAKAAAIFVVLALVLGHDRGSILK